MAHKVRVVLYKDNFKSNLQEHLEGTDGIEVSANLNSSQHNLNDGEVAVNRGEGIEFNSNKKMTRFKCVYVNQECTMTKVS